jgi:hypothetical protein
MKLGLPVPSTIRAFLISRSSMGLSSSLSPRLRASGGVLPDSLLAERFAC